MRVANSIAGPRVKPFAAAESPAPSTRKTRNFDPAYCKRSAPHEAVNDGNLADWRHAFTAHIGRIGNYGVREGLSLRSESFMEQAAAPPFIMPD